MIYLLANRVSHLPANLFISQWAPHLRDRIEFVSYRDLLGRRRFQRGTFVFMTQHPTDTTRAFLAEAARQMAAAGCRVLNPLDRTLGRYDLLLALRDAGINDFRAYRPDEFNTIEHFPVFVLPEHRHSGNLTGLLYSIDELRTAFDALDEKAKGYDVIATEYVDTVDANGIFRKYSVFRIGDRFIPRHVLFSKNWITKSPDLAASEMLEEEQRFLDSNPHAEAVRAVFDIARIDFGRIDYAAIDGGIRVWEINMNPSYASPILSVPPDRAHMQVATLSAIADAIAALDMERDDCFELRFDRATQRDAGVRLRHHAARFAARSVRRAGLTRLAARLGTTLDRVQRYGG